MDRDLVLNILNCCFPLADNIKIIQNILEDGNQHFTSNVTRFIVEYEQDRKIYQKYLVIKIPITSSRLFAVYDSLGIFDREIYVYEKVIPRINKYLHRSLSPAHFLTADKILVLEDLTTRGFRSGEKLPLLDLFQTECTMKALAHFHSASHKLCTEDPNILKNFLTSHLGELEFRKSIIKWGPIVFDLLKRKGETHLLDKVEAAISFLRKDDDEISALLDWSKFKFIVLNRGDNRKENLFFRPASYNQAEVQFIDFQMSLWSSPLRDIIYLLTTSVSVDVIETHFDDLIGGYLHELNEKLEKLNCASTYKRAEFDEDFRKLGFYLISCVVNSCLFLSPIDRKQIDDIFVLSKSDIKDIHDVCLDDEKFVSAIYT